MLRGKNTTVSWLTDIPTPYRNHRYERMAEIFPEHGLDLTVHFMAWSDPLRPWKFGADQLRYPHRVHRGVNLHRIADSFHVNPGILWELRRRPAEVTVVAGWASPTALLAPFALPSASLRLLESESNVQSSRFTSGGWRAVKAAAIRRYHAYLGPSRRSLDLLEMLEPSVVRRPFIEFPNLIDKGVFGDGVARMRGRRDEIRRELEIDDATELWVCPARLESFKGLHLFLPLLEGVEGVRLLVCGEGSLRPALQKEIDAKKLPVRLVGQKSEAEMVRLYAAADLFVLPSLSDPSPLSPIEACAAGLPLLVSRRIGNFDDVLEEEGNGWGYDADHPESNRDRIRRIAAAGRAALAAMGARSAQRYAGRFDSDTCVTHVARRLRELHDERAGTGRTGRG